MGLAKTPIQDSSLAQQKALALTPKFIAALSIVGYIYIIYDVFRLPRAKRLTYHRILLGMSLSGLLTGVALFCTTWPFPPDVVDVYGAAGTQETCSLQGYVAQTGVSGMIYSGSLSIYYYLVIERRWTQHHLYRSRLEVIMHILAVTFGLATSSIAAGFGLFNPAGWFCWMESLPYNCRESWQSFKSDDIKCTRGDNATLFQWLFFYIWLWLIILLVTIIMTLIVVKFWIQERRNRKWRNEAGAGPGTFGNSKQMKELVLQSVFYVFAFYITWIFPTILRITEQTNNNVYFSWEMLDAIFAPSKGIWDLFVYIRPRLKRIRENHQEEKRRRRSRPAQTTAPQNVGTIDTTAAVAVNGKTNPSDATPEQGHAPQKKEMSQRRGLLSRLKHKISSMYRNIKEAVRVGDDGLGGGVVDSAGFQANEVPGSSLHDQGGAHLVPSTNTNISNPTGSEAAAVTAVG